MAVTDDALMSLIDVVADIHQGRLSASRHDIEVLVNTLDILNRLGGDN